MRALLPSLVLTLCASVALASPPGSQHNGTQAAAAALVHERLLLPLHRARSKRKKFSRMAAPPAERRVRVLDTVAVRDTRGKYFLRFAVDTRHRRDVEDTWDLDSMTGCAYPDSEQVFVRRGRGHVPARAAVGKPGRVRDDVCVAAKDEVAQAAQLRR